MTKSIIITDPISSFPRDQIPFVLRVKASVKNGELGQLRTIRTRGIMCLIKGISSGFHKIEELRSGEDGAAYIMLGYREAISGKYSLSACIASFRHCCDELDRMGYVIRFVLPIIKSKKITKEQKSFFAALHKEIKEICASFDDAKCLNAPFIGTDMNSPRKPSIVAAANAIGHDIAVRKIKDVIETMDKRSNNLRLVKQTEELKRTRKGSILITEELPAPSKKNRARRKEQVQ